MAPAVVWTPNTCHVGCVQIQSRLPKCYHVMEKLSFGIAVSHKCSCFPKEMRTSRIPTTQNAWMERTRQFSIYKSEPKVRNLPKVPYLVKITTLFVVLFFAGVRRKFEPRMANRSQLTFQLQTVVGVWSSTVLWKIPSLALGENSTVIN